MTSLEIILITNACAKLVAALERLMQAIRQPYGCRTPDEQGLLALLSRFAFDGAPHHDPACQRDCIADDGKALTVLVRPGSADLGPVSRFPPTIDAVDAVCRLCARCLCVG